MTFCIDCLLTIYYQYIHRKIDGHHPPTKLHLHANLFNFGHFVVPQPSRGENSIIAVPSRHIHTPS